MTLAEWGWLCADSDDDNDGWNEELDEWNWHWWLGFYSHTNYDLMGKWFQKHDIFIHLNIDQNVVRSTSCKK